MTTLYKTLMFTKTTALSFAFSLLCSCAPQNYNQSNAAAIQEGQTAANDFIRDGGGSISIALVDANHVIWNQAFGLADREANLAPTENTMFGIGSIAKLFAAMSIMKLVEKNLVKLDEPIVTYLPSFKMADPEYKKITVRMLINHSAGLPGSEYRNGIIRTPVPQYLNQVLESLQTERLKAPPGYMSVYCNDCVTLVEAVVAAKSGKSYTTFVQDEIFTPLGMNHTRFANTPHPQGSSFAKTYAKGAPKPQEIVNLPASGGIASTANDMGKIAMMFLGRGAYGQTRILSENSIAAMAVDQTAGKFNPIHSDTWAYGLGWDSVMQPGLKAVGYDGWAKGGDTADYGTFLMVSPKADLGIVVLGASGFNSEKAKSVAERVLLRVLVERGAIPAFPAPIQRTVLPVTPASKDLITSMAGIYAESGSIIKLEGKPDASILISMRSDDSWTQIGEPLKLRGDGWFASDKDPQTSFKVVTANLLGKQTPYLVKRTPAGFGHYLDSTVVYQRVYSKLNELSPAWNARLSKTWVVVNANPDDFTWNQMDPHLRLTTVPELKGLIFAHAPLEPSSFLIVDPSSADNVGLMMLVIPQIGGRDLNDLTVINKEGEEWIHFSSYLHKPLSLISELKRNAENVITIGPEGYLEWRTVQSGTTESRISITTAGEWRLFDASFKTIAHGKGNGVMSLPRSIDATGTTTNYIALFGEPGATITLQVD